MRMMWKTLLIIYFGQLHYLNAVPSVSLCSSPTKNQACILECSDTTITAPVAFEHPSGTSRGSCIVPGNNALCNSLNYNINQTLPITYLYISSLDKTRDEGEWRCVHGATPSLTQRLEVSSPLGTQKTPQATITGSALKVTCDMPCQYPTSAVSVEVIYAEKDSTNYGPFPSAPTVVTDFTVNTGCDSYESNYKAEFTFTKSNNLNSLLNKKVTCKCNFTHSMIQQSTGDKGPASALVEIKFQDLETTTQSITDTTTTSSSQTTTELVTTSTESLTTTQPETTSTDSVSTTSKSVTTSTDSLTTTQPETTSTDSVSTTSKSETTTRSYTGKIVTEGDLTTNQPTSTPVADGSSVMTTVGHTSNTKLSGLSRDEIIAIGSIVGFFIILFIVAIVTYVVYTRIRNNKNTKDERENQEHYHKHQGQMNRHEYRYNDYNTRGNLYGEGFNIKQEKGERYMAQGGDPNKRQKMMTTRSYTTYQKPREHDYNHYKSANTVSTYYPRMYGESHNYGFDMEMSPYIESFQYYKGSTHGSTHGSYYNHQNPERSGGRHHGRYQGRQDRPYPATSNYNYPNGQYYYQY